MIPRFLLKMQPGLFTAVVVIAILWLTLAPHPLPDTDVPMFENADKVVHALMFGGLVFAMVLDRELYNHQVYEQTGVLPKKHARVMVLFVVASVLFGGLIELLQAWMDLGRGCDFYDFIADAIGAVVFALISPKIVVWLLNR
jgi:hypothetical protein